MKKIVPVLLIFSILSCTKSKYYNANILYQDDALCPICGGYFIQIQDSIYQNFNLDSNNTIKSSVFPLKCNIEFNKKNQRLRATVIEVTKIEF